MPVRIETRLGPPKHPLPKKCQEAHAEGKQQPNAKEDSPDQMKDPGRGESRFNPWEEEVDPFDDEYDAILAQLDLADMVVPGEASAQDGNPGQQTAKKRKADSAGATEVGSSSGGGGGGVSGGSGMGYVVPRSRLSESVHFKSYKKVHSFLSFGVASVVIKNPITTSAPFKNIYYLTTSLAEIPVHSPRMYIDPAEYNVMQPGETCVALKVTVTQRNDRVAFETAATASGLATLNQNKNGVYAIGLNKLPYYMLGKYTYDTTETMKPVKVIAPTSTPTTENMYGISAAFGPVAAAPMTYTGDPLVLENYAVIGIQTSATVDTVGPNCGWPNLVPHQHRFDAADFVGQPIVEYSYEPMMGMLKPPPAFQNFSPVAPAVHVAHDSLTPAA